MSNVGVMSSSLRKNLKGAILLLQVEAVEDRVDSGSTLFIKQTTGRVRRGTSTNGRSITFVGA